MSHIELQTHKKNDATSMHPHKDPMMKPLTWKTEGLFEVDDAYNDLFEGYNFIECVCLTNRFLTIYVVHSDSVTCVPSRSLQQWAEGYENSHPIQ